MVFMAAKCPQCGANINVDNTKEAGICSYCGTAFITEKAISLYQTVNNFNINNATINIINEHPKDKNRFEKPYKIFLSRTKSFIGGAMVYYFEIDNATYSLPNGGEIIIETDLRKLNGNIIMNFVDGVQKVFRFSLIGNGDDISVKVAATFTQSIKIVNSSVPNVNIVRIS